MYVLMQWLKHGWNQHMVFHCFGSRKMNVTLMYYLVALLVH